jgi:[FeFe] hydrogenase (group B1/B3)
MHFDNNATRTRRELLIRAARLFFDGTFTDLIDRIPIDMRPRGDKSLRCCIYKDRAIIKHRLMGILGFGTDDETDELTTLKEYAVKSLERSETSGPLLSLIDEACSACVESKYFVTNACRGCMARPCMINCPKKSIVMGEQGQAKIDPSSCVNCGLCMKVCPYHAIIRMPVPCEEACPVGAIEKTGNGKAHIDFDKCILCGKCMRECPFGAIMEKSQLIDVLAAILGEKKVVLMVAPAVAGQFVAEFGQVVAAILKLGFYAVIEVAHGAHDTAIHEAEELEERLEHGAPFMTTSCCPSFMQAVKKHIPGLIDKVSSTPTPMHYTANKVASIYPDALKVFVSPCIAKRQEAMDDNLVDMVITCEELGAMIAAKGIDVAECDPVESGLNAKNDGRGFPMIGGVTAAVNIYLKNPEKIKPQLMDGLTRQNMKLLKIYSGPKGLMGNNFIEVMACEGGCVNGPCTMENPVQSKKRILSLMDK